MATHIEKPMDLDELVSHLQIELKKHPIEHTNFCDSYPLKTRDTYCFIRFGGLIFSLRADTKYEALRNFLTEVDKKKSTKDVVKIEDAKTENPKLRLVKNDSPSGWYCYYQREDEQLKILIDEKIQSIRRAHNKKLKMRKKFPRAS